METVKLRGLNKEVSRIGLGCWALGGGPAWGGDKDRQKSIDMIRTCPKIGVSLLDTAPAYNFGQSERIVGEALKGMNREDISIITKFGIVWTRTGSPFIKVGDTMQYKNLSPESIMEEIDQSLERLGTDYIDIYMSHWQSVEPCFTPISETIEALNKLKQQGKIKAIGAANVTTEHIEEYEKYGGIDIVQAKYSILDRAIEKELLPACVEKGIVIQAYSPLEQGLLTGACKRDYQPVGAQCTKKWFQPENFVKAMDFIDWLAPLCEKYRCTVPSLVMSWILAQNKNITILSGSTCLEQLQPNMQALDILLSAEDISLMREVVENLD